MLVLALGFHSPVQPPHMAGLIPEESGAIVGRRPLVGRWCGHCFLRFARGGSRALLQGLTQCFGSGLLFAYGERSEAAFTQQPNFAIDI